ncbi:NB-ARC domain-containing protein [Allokutzneria sp. A3M-2-11 16]|uniref:AfsR/SARP family transcriptional regulator n=1 Tax=Allokutzneria sp. A3M-2-11 16 TaxID=2962043 RepID=UPI0020B78287|nr:BTAD domain-containing putative transcriptional regulator [Allokutzneria sp. A3M-2-11 16]MCP3804796.1 NB-ARC domain-containing protein [Allokutzneria sp. A3M-2-11 16]
MGAGFEFGLLGPFEVRCGEDLVDIPSGKLRVVLAALLLAPGEIVTGDRFAHWLGDAAEHDGWPARLQSYIGRLREILAPYPGGRELIKTLAGGYLIDVDPSTVDRFRFVELIRAAERAGAADAAGTLATALELYRGPALTGVPSPELLREVGPQLEEDRLTALERRIEHELALGRHAFLVGELQALVRRYPLREGLWRSLVLALHDTGRQAEALAAYREVQRHLAETLGIDPGPALREAHARVLGGVGGEAGEGGHVATSPWVAACSLPPDVPDLVGRDELLAEIARWLTAEDDGPPVAVVHGLSGIGKSALALRLAHHLRERYPDGLHWLRSRDQRASAAMGDLLYATGVTAPAIPSAPEARESAYRNRLYGKRLLIVLDDVTDAAEASALITGSTRCAFIVTAQRALRALSGRVRNFRVDELSPADSYELFARTVGTGRVGREEPATREIVSYCGGHPLALRVLGARLGALPARRIGAIVPRLRDLRGRLDQLATPDHQVRTSLALGYSSLPAELRRAFRRLSPLGENTFASWVAGLLAGDADGDRVVAALVDRGMLTPAGVDETGEPRYQLHSLLALYAGELAAEDPEDRRAAVRLLVDGYLVFSERANAGMVVVITDITRHPGLRERTGIAEHEVDRNTADPVAWFRSERHNLAALVGHAADAGLFAEAIALLNRLASTEDDDGNWRLITRLFSVIRDRARERGDENTALYAEVGRINVGMVGADLQQQIADYEKCVGLLARTSFTADHARTVATLAFCYYEQSRYAEALEAARRGVELARSADDGRVLVFCLRMLGTVVSKTGSYEEAVALFERAIAVAREHAVNEPSLAVTEANVRYCLATSALQHEDLERARAEAEAVFALLARSNRQLTRGYASKLLSQLHCASGNWADAETWAVRALRVLEPLDDRRGQSYARFHLAEALAAQGKHEDAIAELLLALPVMEELGLAKREEAARLLERCSTENPPICPGTGGRT